MLQPSKIIFIFLFSFVLGSCSHSIPEPTDTPTAGEVKIVVDESFKSLFSTEIYTFESIYDRAHVIVDYLPEGDALARLINDSCKVVVMCRDLNKEEQQTFKSNNLYPISTKIAEDAIALIVNNENKDSAITVESLKLILQGKDTLWNQLNANSTIGKINCVFDNKSSANTRYMKDTLLGGKEFAKNVFALNSTNEVIDYVSTHPSAIGFIGVNMISDLDDPKVQSLLKKIKVLAVSNTEIEKAAKPYQGNIQSKDYPFTRNVYMISRQTRAGLGMGFVSFVAGEKGQLMILKAGLIPGFPPERNVKVKIE